MLKVTHYLVESLKCHSTHPYTQYYVLLCVFVRGWQFEYSNIIQVISWKILILILHRMHTFLFYNSISIIATIIITYFQHNQAVA